MRYTSADPGRRTKLPTPCRGFSPTSMVKAGAPVLSKPVIRTVVESVKPKSASTASLSLRNSPRRLLKACSSASTRCALAGAFQAVVTCQPAGAAASTTASVRAPRPITILPTVSRENSPSTSAVLLLPLVLRSWLSRCARLTSTSTARTAAMMIRFFCFSIVAALL